MRSYRFFDLFVGLFVTILLVSNLIAVKPSQVGGLAIGAAILLFPVDYIIGDVLTEVYGYAQARRVIWIGFACAILTSFVCFVADISPPAPGYNEQAAFHAILGQFPRTVAASMIAYAAGEFTNSYVLARMKVWTEGRHLWSRAIGSTITSELVDSCIFYPLAFWGRWPDALVIRVALTNYLIKVMAEVVATPITYRVVAFLKRAEGVDVFDRQTNFNPLRID